MPYLQFRPFRCIPFRVIKITFIQRNVNTRFTLKSNTKEFDHIFLKKVVGYKFLKQLKVIAFLDKKKKKTSLKYIFVHLHYSAIVIVKLQAKKIFQSTSPFSLKNGGNDVLRCFFTLKKMSDNQL